jgi:hypothetical protein
MILRMSLGEGSFVPLFHVVRTAIGDFLSIDAQSHHDDRCENHDVEL